MQQRRVRLGDVLDDYCPRERRITNHAVVAMIDDEVKQTRCSTCDAEHEYKEAKVPAPRRKKTGALSTDRPEALVRSRPSPSDSEPAAELDAPGAPEMPESTEPSAPPPPASLDPTPTAESISAQAADEPPSSEEDAGPQPDEWVHRPLIRATLPRQEGQTPERKAPDFTIRQPGGRFDGNRNGQRPRGRGRSGQMRTAQGPGGQGTRHGSGQPTRHGSGQAQGPRHGSRHGSGQGPRHDSGQGNRSGPAQGNRGGRPPGQGRGPGRKRGR